MCGILAGTKVSELEGGWAIARKRGSQGYSYNHVGDTVEFIQTGKDAICFCPLTKAWLHVYHFVTPTGPFHYHPAVRFLGEQVYHVLSLWHNGMLRSSEVARLQKELGLTTDWDTELFTYSLRLDDFENCLSEIDGTFACLLFVPSLGLITFRTPTVPLMSTRYTLGSDLSYLADSRLLPAETIFQVTHNGDELVLTEIGKFKAKSSPYFIS